MKNSSRHQLSRSRTRKSTPEFEALDQFMGSPKLPPSPSYVRFTSAARAALMEEMQRRQWGTAREAYGWVWNHLGLHVSYLTVWRFLNAQGCFTGSTPRSRKFQKPVELHTLPDEK